MLCLSPLPLCRGALLVARVVAGMAGSAVDKKVAVMGVGATAVEKVEVTVVAEKAVGK